MYHTSAPWPIGPAPQRERRKAPRTPLVFTLAKLITNGREWPCMVRNLSASGMQIQLPVPPLVNAVVTVEMQGMAPKQARVRWAKGRIAGLLFDTPCSVDEVLAGRRNLAGSPRFRLDRAATLNLEDGPVSVLALEISIDEVRLAASQPLGAGCPASLDLGLVGLSARGTIGARVGDSYQFFFDKPWASVTLAQLLQGARD